MSDESGQEQVYVQPFPALGAKWQISGDRGFASTWARHGRELYYRNGRSVMAVTIETQPTFVAGEPHLLFSGNYREGRYSGAPDGRFIMIEPLESTASSTEITLLRGAQAAVPVR